MFPVVICVQFFPTFIMYKLIMSILQKYKERFIACWYLILQKAKTSFLPPIYNVIKYIDKLGQCYGPYSYFNKGQGTNFSYLPMGYWLESMDWVHLYIYLTVVTILGGKYHFQCSIICFFNKWYINFVFASYIFFFYWSAIVNICTSYFQFEKHC